MDWVVGNAALRNQFDDVVFVVRYTIAWQRVEGASSCKSRSKGRAEDFEVVGAKKKVRKISDE
jgi:hypothetical protein